VTASDGRAVFVDAPARLHFGVLDLRGDLGRWFGGIGAAAPAPTLRLCARRSDSLRVGGDDARLAGAFARRFLAFHRVSGGAAIHVERSLPRHVGLGSGTQLGLAVARALAELYCLRASAPDLAIAVGRGERSAVGTWIFEGGGLVLEGGRRPNGGVGPLLARLPFPATWRCIVAVPRAGSRMSGAAEAEAFAKLPAPPPDEVAHVSHLVTMGLLPALAEADLARFGGALERIQQITGRWFAPVQGGVFAPGPTAELVRELKASGAYGVGQSSWGPAVYGIVEGDEPARRLAERARDVLRGDGTVYAGAFRACGARVWREGDATPAGEAGASETSVGGEDLI